MPKSANMPADGAISPAVAVKGIRNGLLFTVADDVSFETVFAELSERLNGEQGKTSSPVAVTAYLDFGERALLQEEEDAIRVLFSNVASFTLGGIEGPPERRDLQEKSPYVHKGTVRSGKVIEHDGDIVVIGDVNPGGELIASGDIYVMGYLRGFAHAGARGNLRAVVAATYFDPLQVRIAGVARRSPERQVSPAEMEFAYLDGDHMAIEKMSVLGQYRARIHSAFVVL